MPAGHLVLTTSGQLVLTASCWLARTEPLRTVRAVSIMCRDLITLPRQRFVTQVPQYNARSQQVQSDASHMQTKVTPQMGCFYTTISGPGPAAH